MVNKHLEERLVRVLAEGGQSEPDRDVPIRRYESYRPSRFSACIVWMPKIGPVGVSGRHRGPEDGMSGRGHLRRRINGIMFWFRTTGEDVPP